MRVRSLDFLFDFSRKCGMYGEVVDLYKKLNTRSVRSSGVDSKAYSIVAPYLLEDIGKLEDLLGMNLSDWKVKYE